jgi:hypothetical protein
MTAFCKQIIACKTIILLMLLTSHLQAQVDSTFLGQYGTRVITTSLPFLLISPDARASGMGDIGAATKPDNHSIYWNPAKTAFLEEDFGFALSYTPWLKKIIDDMSISYLSFYKKITREQAVGFEFKYFDLGRMDFTDYKGEFIQDFRPKEFVFGLSYSRMLVENTLGLGVTARYIHSNLAGNALLNDPTLDSSPANVISADVGLYYNKELLLSGVNSNIAFGAVISNIGSKVTYTDDDSKMFIPTNLRIGTAFTTNLDPYNSLTFGLDLNKLLVPTPPIYYRDSMDVNGRRVIYRGRSTDRSVLSGVFGSFTDAPGGFREELQEIMFSLGGEYNYNDVFAVRMGYFWENQNKGDRKFLSFGLGFQYQVFGIDLAYLVPKNEHPLAETMRISMVFNWEGKNSRTVKE